MFFLVQFVFFVKIVLGAQLISCPKNNVKFEKIIGSRPPIQTPLLLYQEPSQLPVTLECLRKCSAIDDCHGFILNYNNATCYWYRQDDINSDENHSDLDINVAWFAKTCLNVTNCPKLWIFERAPGATLVGDDIKTIPYVVSRQQCQQNCLDESTFQCRSAKYTVGHLNETEIVGKCTLSNTDRLLTPTSFRVSRWEEEYFGNQCSTVYSDQFCSFEEYENVTLAHTDIHYENKTKEQCEELCLHLVEFVCRGYSLVINSDESTSCLIHSEDSKIHGPKLLLDRPNSTYYEKAPCLNITVSCSDNNMVINYRPKSRFEGRIYMKDFFDDPACSKEGKDQELLVLSVPLNVGTCGINIAKDTNNSTLMYTTMIVQFNPLVQTQSDRVVRIGCIYGTTKVVLGAGVNFTSKFPITGSTVVNSSTNSPNVVMRLVDFATKKELSETRIGQEIELIIEAQSTKDNMDIWAGHLIAMTENGQDSILLLDDRGCPTNLNIFPALIKKKEGNSTQLSAVFQAFKFSTSPIIRFSVIVQFCQTECPKPDCGNYINKRLKREFRQLRNEDTTVLSLPKHHYDIIGKEIGEIPLELKITVKTTDGPIADKFIYGTNTKLLMAESPINYVCVDYYLLIGLIVLWVVVLILMAACGFCIIKRYRKHYEIKCAQYSMEELNKNFELGENNLDNRRVRFAKGTTHEYN